MKFQAENKIKENVPNAMRQLRYHFWDAGGREMNFTRALGYNRYPRFHIYISEKGNNLFFNLHIDQKAPSYGGHTAHSGEYFGERIEEEAKRIKNFFENKKEL